MVISILNSDHVWNQPKISIMQKTTNHPGGDKKQSTDT